MVVFTTAWLSGRLHDSRPGLRVASFICALLHVGRISWSDGGVCDRVVEVVLRVAGRDEEDGVDGGFRTELAPNLRIAGSVRQDAVVLR